MHDIKALHALGFEDENQYNLYMKVKESLEKEVPVGIAS
jgi:hypothetical protein